MSTVTLDDTVTTGTVYGTYAAAVTYITGRYGESYTAWLALSADNRKRTLISAADYIDQQIWQDDYDTFAERDAVPAFVTASYELAVLIAADPEIVQALDQGSNIARVYAGGAGVDYFNPTSSKSGSAPKLPPILMRLIGQYLAASTTGGPDGGSGQEGSCHNPFSECSDYDRSEP